MFFVLIAVSSCYGITLGNERDINVFIDENNFGYTHTVEANEYLYMKVRIIDENSVPLSNYHIDFKVEDDRGVLVGDYSRQYFNIAGQQLEVPRMVQMNLSDENGFINLVIPINSCGATNDSFCYDVDKKYTFRIIQKNLDRREDFIVVQQTLDHNWLGQGFRWVIMNMDYLFIVGITLLICISVLGFLFINWKRKRR